MGKGQHLGEFEQVVMLAVARPSGGGHGAGIHKEILDTTGRDVSISSVYVTLNRLEAKGYVEASVELGDEGRGGRPRKCYALTPLGIGQLRSARLEAERLWSGLDFDPVRAGEGP